MWQPIESAPKNGSSILLATPKGRIADGFWSPVYGVWSWPYVMVEPTHWMPLLERPSAQAQPAPSVPDTYAAGINAVAAMLQSKADEYAKEHGHDDMGGLSFGPGMGGEIKMDYYTNLIELVDDVRAMLTAAPNVPSVPDGWKLVPIEPTTEIRKAMHYAYWQSPQLPYHDGSPELWNAAYAAMLAAAPEAKS